MLQSNSYHYPSENGKTEKQQTWTRHSSQHMLEDRASHGLAGDIFIFPPPSMVWEPEEEQDNSVCQGKAGKDNEERRMRVGLKV